MMIWYLDDDGNLNDFCGFNQSKKSLVEKKAKEMINFINENDRLSKLPNINEESLENWINVDANVPSEITLTDIEIVNLVTQEENGGDDDDDDDDKEEECSITWSQASTQINNFIKFAECRTFLSDQDYMTLIRIQDKFNTAKFKSLRQQKITEVFKKREPSPDKAFPGTVLTFLEHSILSYKFCLVKF